MSLSSRFCVGQGRPSFSQFGRNWLCGEMGSAEKRVPASLCLRLLVAFLRGDRRAVGHGLGFGGHRGRASSVLCGTSCWQRVCWFGFEVRVKSQTDVPHVMGQKLTEHTQGPGSVPVPESRCGARLPPSTGGSCRRIRSSRLSPVT